MTPEQRMRKELKRIADSIQPQFLSSTNTVWHGGSPTMRDAAERILRIADECPRCHTKGECPCP